MSSIKHIAIDEFTNVLTTFLNDKGKQNKIVLIGDFNISLLVNIHALSLILPISRTTRFLDTLKLSDASFLDHIETKSSRKFMSGILHFSISDHLPIFINISFRKEIMRLNETEFRNVNQYNKNIFFQKINGILWNDF